MAFFPLAEQLNFGFGYAVVTLDPALYLRGVKYAQHNEEKIFSVQRRLGERRESEGCPTTWQARFEPKDVCESITVVG